MYRQISVVQYSGCRIDKFAILETFAIFVQCTSPNDNFLFLLVLLKRGTPEARLFHRRQPSPFNSDKQWCCQRHHYAVAHLFDIGCIAAVRIVTHCNRLVLEAAKEKLEVHNPVMYSTAVGSVTPTRNAPRKHSRLSTLPSSHSSCR